MGLNNYIQLHYYIKERSGWKWAESGCCGLEEVGPQWALTPCCCRSLFQNVLWSGCSWLVLSPSLPLGLSRNVTSSRKPFLTTLNQGRLGIRLSHNKGSLLLLPQDTSHYLMPPATVFLRLLFPSKVGGPLLTS